MNENGICNTCGNDVHGEENIKKELKLFSEMYQDIYNVKTMGHPMVIIILGDLGADVIVSPFFHPPKSKKLMVYDMFLERLETVMEDCKDDPAEAFQIDGWQE